MAKSNKQMARELLARYKEELQKEQMLLKEYYTVLREWENQVENGSESRETGVAVDKAYSACELARIDVNAIARLTLEYVMKIEKEENTSE